MPPKTNQPKGTHVKTLVWVTTDFSALHCWPDAPAQVAYLRNLHRHVFKVKLSVKVMHYDRHVEFMQLKAQLDTACHMLQTTLNSKGSESMSCEMMASFIHTVLKSYYAIDSIEVSEDGENGATLYYA